MLAMRTMTLLTLFALIAIVEATPTSAAIINTVDRGWYNSDGGHSPSNNYIAGQNDFYRDFFVFDLSGVSTTETITSASLRLWNPSQNSFPGTATYQMYDVSTSISALTGGFGGTSAFNDLGTGDVYASRAITSADAGTFVVIDLDSSGIAALNAARGGTFATGGRLFSSAFSFVFSFTGGTPNDALTQLVFETQVVPEPSSIALFGLGGVGLALVAARRRREKKATAA